jgi:hypothetical protein
LIKPGGYNAKKMYLYYLGHKVCRYDGYGFKEPTSENTILIIGSILLQDQYYTENLGVYREGIELAVFGNSVNG